jgi:hypothetical protein
MSEANELPNEAVEEWVLSYLKYRVNKNQDSASQAQIIEGMLFYARDHLLDRGIKENDADLVNEAKTINCLVNILRGQPSENYWNGCLKNRGLPINELIFP